MQKTFQSLTAQSILWWVNTTPETWAHRNVDVWTGVSGKSVKQTGTWATLHTCPSQTHQRLWQRASLFHYIHTIPNRSDKQSVSSGILSGVLSALIKGHKQFGRKKEQCFRGHPFNRVSLGMTCYQLSRFWLSRVCWDSVWLQREDL